MTKTLLLQLQIVWHSYFYGYDMYCRKGKCYELQLSDKDMSKKGKCDELCNNWHACMYFTRETEASSLVLDTIIGGAISFVMS